MELSELEAHLPMVRIAVLYAAAYLYEHREQADHGELVGNAALPVVWHTERGVLMGAWGMEGQDHHSEERGGQ